MITIIDLQAGNFFSLENVIKKITSEVLLSKDYDQISKSKIILLPGVGRFDVFMEKIKKKKIDVAIKNALINKAKFLGICVGMHVLFDKSEEGNCAGLSLISGEIKKFNTKLDFKIPHMGWNTVKIIKDDPSILSNNNKFYFIHSYYADPKCSNNIIGVTEHGREFASIVKKNNIYGVQFHPEKSHLFGRKFLENFLNA